MTETEIEQLQRERAEAINTAREWRRTWQIARGRAMANFAGRPEATQILDYLSQQLNALEHRTRNLEPAQVVANVMASVSKRCCGLKRP